MRQRISDWPEVKANVNPQTLERMDAAASRRALSRADLVREALEALFGAYRSEAR